MIFSLIAENTDASKGLTTGAVVALIICGVIMLAFAIFGTVLRARDISRKAKRVKKKGKSAEASEHKASEEKQYDFSNLTEEEKDLIRKHRDKSKK